MRSVLVVDDDERLVSLIVASLKSHGYDAVGTTSAVQAKSTLLSTHFDAIVVDWMMPNESGIEFITAIRKSVTHLRDIPAIMLTAIDCIDNKVEGFEAGFDDYITKPFEDRELVARLNAIINRSTQKFVADTLVKFENFTFNPNSNELHKGRELIILSTTELTLLKTLSQKPNYPFSRAELAKQFSFQVSDRTIDVQVTRLRKKFGDDTKNPRIIKSVRHIGYSLCCK
ncbi:MAG: response regulator transcription factor [Holosporales bacterium]|nr:response regulator transcription factor [Holosporales bacterium]